MVAAHLRQHASAARVFAGRKSQRRGGRRGESVCNADRQKLCVRMYPLGDAAGLTASGPVALDREDCAGVWTVIPYGKVSRYNKALDATSHVAGEKRMVPGVRDEYHVVAVKKIPGRVAKYDVRLRENALHAVQAMHSILTRMVLFTCSECKERFPSFHPAYVPPPKIAKSMELLKKGTKGVAACNVEVSSWEEFPPFDVADGLALACRGVCLRCQRDMDSQAKDQC